MEAAFVTQAYQDSSIRLLAAALLSGLVGIEREVHGRAAGFRTHILVGTGSALITLVSLFMTGLHPDADPGRIAAQVVSGIGFIGAGTIMRFRASIRGLTTAASLWTVAGIGMACAAGFYRPAIYTTAIVLATLWILSKIDHFWLRPSRSRTLLVHIGPRAELMEDVRKIMTQFRAHVLDIGVHHLPSGDWEWAIDVRGLPTPKQQALLAQLLNTRGVKGASWERAITSD